MAKIAIWLGFDPPFRLNVPKLEEGGELAGDTVVEGLEVKPDGTYVAPNRPRWFRLLALDEWPRTHYPAWASVKLPIYRALELEGPPAAAPAKATAEASVAENTSIKRPRKAPTKKKGGK